MDKKTILVVEDETEISNLITKKLEANDFVTLTAKTVNEAMDVLSRSNVDVIWLDHYLLGSRSGFDLITELRSKGNEAAKIPVFVVSNTAGPEEMQSYIEFGVEKYYVKSNATLNSIVEDLKKFFAN